jgi:hypothetical protein
MRRSASTVSSPLGQDDSPAEPTPAVPQARARRTSRAARAAVAPIPLGSLTQNGAREGVACQSCGSERVTSLAMTLTDGTPVRFLSCHRCEERTWLDLDGVPLPVDRVLDMTRKLR